MKTIISFFASIFCIGSMYAMVPYQTFNQAQFGDTFIGKTNIGNAELLQVKVLDQFSAEGSAPASCAYHALRDGLEIAQATLYAGKTDHYIRELSSVAHMQEKLGSNGSWRNYIQTIHPHDAQTDWLDGNDTQKVANFALDKELNITLPVAVYGDATVARPDSSIPLEKALKEVSEFAAAQVRDEFKDLIDLARSGKDFVGVVLIYQERWGVPDILEAMISGVECTFRDWVSLILQSSIYQPPKNIYGHWIPLVVISKGGQRQYIVTDSAGNYNRLQDPKVHEVIALLEGGSVSYAESSDVATLVGSIFEGSASLSQVAPKDLIYAQLAQAQYHKNKQSLEVRFDRSSKLFWAVACISVLYGAYRYKHSHDESAKKQHPEHAESRAIKAF